jgi:hypothetical protein
MVTRELNLTTQQSIIYDYMMKGRSLSNHAAIAFLGVGSLSSRIAELRGMGLAIVDRRETDQFGRQFKVYYIPAAKVDAAEKELEA